MFKETDAGPMLINVLMIVLGVMFVLWVTTLTKQEVDQLMNGTFKVIALIAMQPGLFLTANLLTQEDKHWKVKARNGLLAIVFAILLPLQLLAWIYQHFFGITL